MKRVLLIAIAVVLVVGCRKKNVDAAREERQTSVTLVAPAPLPTAIPLVGPEGVDADGYPLRAVDRAALRSLLYHRSFDSLTTYIETFQSDFEADAKKEYWPFDAAAAFDTAEPEIQPMLDAWVAAKPASFAPLVARGTYLTALGYARRGGGWAKDTPQADLDAMTETFTRARKDLTRALELRPRAGAASRALIRLEGADGTRPAAQRAADAAVALCPTCFLIRVTWLFNSTPRWGGTYEAMAAYAAAAPKADNRRLRFLAGYADYDRASMKVTRKDYEGALVDIQRAIALGEHWQFLLERASIERHLDHPIPAKQDADRALALRPGFPDALFERARAFDRLQQWEWAAQDLLEGMRVEATNPVARALAPRAVQGLLAEAVRKWRAGNTPVALRMLDLAADLAPTNADVQRWRAYLLLPPNSPGAPPAPVDPGAAAAPPSNGDPPEIASAQARADAAPDDFEAHRSLDYALARRGQFDRVVTMWNAYLAAHPNEGRAYLERGGAHFNLHHAAEAKADATRACELGISEGCVRAKQVR